MATDDQAGQGFLDRLPIPRRLLMPAVIGVGLLAGVLVAVLLPLDLLIVPADTAMNTTGARTTSGAQKEYYACPMFCTRLDEPGQCPVCGMTMERFVDTGAVIPLDENARRNLVVRAETIQRRFLARQIRTVGTFEVDETREKRVAAWVDGRIEKLHADFKGIVVKKGAPLFDLYSPTLYSAQREVQLAHAAMQAARKGTPARDEARRLLTTTRDKLILLGLTSEQVDAIQKEDKPRRTVTILSPGGGIVHRKMAHEGMYVKEGQVVLNINDHDLLWLMVDLHERDLAWVALGQAVQVSVQAYPGRSFEGTVGYIDHHLREKTRTVRARVEVANPGLRFKPGMYATVMIFAELNADGSLAAPELTGAFACPVHQLEGADNESDTCTLCGKTVQKRILVKGSKPGKVWAVPREAVLSTGRRKLVYVEWWVRPSNDGSPATVLEVPEYQGFEVELGPLASEYRKLPGGGRQKLGDYYPMIKGVPTGVPKTPSGGPGARIVTNGQFLIDSQMELTGKPSLMRPAGD